MTITFEDIKKANESIKTTDIKGKEYAEVNQRVKAYKIVFPTGFIETKIVSIEDGVCIMRAQVGYYTDEGVRIVLATGTAFEKQDSSFINKTSYIENCETSAVGRALGLAGFGIDTSIASFEEVANAIENQNKDTKKETKSAGKKVDTVEEANNIFPDPNCITPDQKTLLLRALNETGIAREKILPAGKTLIDDLTKEEYETIKGWFETKHNYKFEG